MVVELREGIYWSDGEPFTADDVVFTVQTLLANSGMRWSAQLNLFVSEVYKEDDYTVVFELKQPNSRFHTFFTARYDAVYIMPEHVWSNVANPMQFRFWPPVSLGQYVVRDADPAGYWELFELREDWERTSVGQVVGKPGPKYVLTIFYGPNERKVIAMAQHELDLLIDLDIEAFQALINRSETARRGIPTSRLLGPTSWTFALSALTWTGAIFTRIATSAGLWRWRSTWSSCRPSTSVAWRG